MDKVKILHITDLHINNFSISSGEYLREDFYESYFTSLADKVKNKFSNVDCLIATGDFINQGSVTNYQHATKVLKFLADKLDLNYKKIGVCIGNHDSKIVKGTIDDIIEEDKSGFQVFASEFANGDSLYSNSFGKFSISKISNEIFLLVLDSTYGRKKNQPGRLENDDINEILHNLKLLNINHPNNILIVASHYPLTHFENYPFPDEDGWYDHHFWRSAVFLKERMANQINQANILWLFGDTHKPSEHIISHQLFIMSGRIGTKIATNSDGDLTPISRQARLISYQEDNRIKITNFLFQQIDHKENPHKGNWVINDPLDYKLKIQNAELIKSEIKTVIIEDLIIEYVKSKQLYEFGRFAIADNLVSLGWVSINNLLADRNGLLPLIVKSSINWLKSRFADLNENNTLLIGIDFWGTIIASQISVSTGCQNFCKASRGNPKHYTSREVFDKGIDFIDLKNITTLVYFTDVVSSGNTLAKVYKILSKIFESKSVTISNHIAISVLCDRNQPYRADLGFLSAFGTFCVDLRIPVIDTSLLPSKDILPVRQIFD